MKKYVPLSLVFSFIIPFVAAASSTSFNTYLSAGTKNTAEVTKVQQFLTKQGFFQASATGYFGPLTKKAVVAFQTQYGISPTGTWGPLTRAKANSLVDIAAAPATGSTISDVSIQHTQSLAGAVLLSKQVIIIWRANKYPADAGVNINLLRKTNDNPKSYEIVRVLAKNTKNTGSFKWIPGVNDNGNDLYIEIACSSEYQFTSGCQVTSEPVKIN